MSYELARQRPQLNKLNKHFLCVPRSCFLRYAPCAMPHPRTLFVFVALCAMLFALCPIPCSLLLSFSCVGLGPKALRRLNSATRIRYPAI